MARSTIAFGDAYMRVTKACTSSPLDGATSSDSFVRLRQEARILGHRHEGGAQRSDALRRNARRRRERAADRLQAEDQVEDLTVIRRLRVVVDMRDVAERRMTFAAELENDLEAAGC